METQTQPTPQQNQPSPQQGGGGLIAAGYILALLALIILPIPLAIAGFVVGVVNLTRGQSGHGIAQIILAVLCGILGAIIGAALWTAGSR